MAPNKKDGGGPPLNPMDLLPMYHGLEVPDPITFITGEDWLNRNDLYPRQGTLIKCVFLRDDLFTEYDLDVINEWTESFRATGNNGMQPDILERIQMCKKDGRKWFREVLAVMGRRGGKGYVGALCMAYVLWNYLATGDPQGHYGIDRSKKIASLIFAGKRQQAKEQLWQDLVNVVVESTCFQPYISDVLAEKLSLYAPHDFVRMKKRQQAGVDTSSQDMASFQIFPKESTVMAGRGPAVCLMGFDEMAHVVASGANRSATEVYDATTPALDQFGKDGFIYAPSSPWQMMGKFYDNYVLSLEREPVEWGPNGEVVKTIPAYPSFFMIQLASWDIYVDWERAHLIPMLPGENAPCYSPKKKAIQSYDDDMRKLEQANPDTFKVERRSHWATALDAYLNPLKVDTMFTGEWNGNYLVQQAMGKMHLTYKAHADPALVNDRFGFAIAHGEQDPDTGLIHCVFDVVHFWEAQDFPDNTIDYLHIEKELWGFIQAFKPDELTFDQWNSASSIQKLQMQIRQANFNKRVQVFKKDTTRTMDFNRWETFKTALNMGWIHAMDKHSGDRAVDIAVNELKFLQLVNGKVDHPDMGPVQSKDVADCMAECVKVIIGDQVNNFLANELGNMRPRAAAEGGFDPFPQMRQQEDAGLSGFMAARQGTQASRESRMKVPGFGRMRGADRFRKGLNPFDGR
jgi:hypothetical protein